MRRSFHLFKMLSVALLSLGVVGMAHSQNNANVATAGPAEFDKINALIQSIEALDGACFWRNGSYYDAKKPALA